MVETLAGGTEGLMDGAGINARFHSPSGVFLHPDGDLFVAELNNQCIRKIDPSGNVFRWAGGGGGCFGGSTFVIPDCTDGPRLEARFNFPTDMVSDSQGNMYIADSVNNRIRKLLPNGMVETYSGMGIGGYDHGALVDGPISVAKFDGPAGMQMDAQDTLYFADRYNHAIRKVTSDGIVNTVAGNRTYGYRDGKGREALFCLPEDLAIASETLYVADAGNNRIRKIDSDGTVTTFAGGGATSSEKGVFADGTGDQARFKSPCGIALDPEGNILVADTGNNRIRLITPQGEVKTIAGGEEGYRDGKGSQARFYHPVGITIDNQGTIYVADQMNDRIRRIKRLPS